MENVLLMLGFEIVEVFLKVRDELAMDNRPHILGGRRREDSEVVGIERSMLLVGQRQGRDGYVSAAYDALGFRIVVSVELIAVISRVAGTFFQGVVFLRAARAALIGRPIVQP